MDYSDVLRNKVSNKELYNTLYKVFSVEQIEIIKGYSLDCLNSEINELDNTQIEFLSFSFAGDVICCEMFLEEKFEIFYRNSTLFNAPNPMLQKLISVALDNYINTFLRDCVIRKLKRDNDIGIRNINISYNSLVNYPECLTKNYKNYHWLLEFTKNHIPLGGELFEDFSSIYYKKEAYDKYQKYIKQNSDFENNLLMVQLMPLNDVPDILKLKVQGALSNFRECGFIYKGQIQLINNIVNMDNIKIISYFIFMKRIPRDKMDSMNKNYFYMYTDLQDKYFATGLTRVQEQQLEDLYVKLGGILDE